MQEKTSMDTVCKQDLCNGCMACINVCNKGAISIKDTLDAYNAVIDEKNACIVIDACVFVREIQHWTSKNHNYGYKDGQKKKT